ncbi:MAG: TonB-dependent receptor [Balneolaceae bacterium]
MIKKIFLSVFLFVGCLILQESAFAQIRGEIKDASTEESVPFAYVHLEEINRTTTADREGKFGFRNIPEGTYTLTVHRIGFRTYTSEFTFNGASDEPIEILLQPQSVSGDEVTVTGEAAETTGSRLEHASTKILGEELRRNLGTTLSETLIDKPGFNERSLGPAPGRPVIRGLGDERVLILSDGERSGDVSAQSADHAVSVDPGGADEIEIARGPAALAYGANAIGGVINVVKNQIPNTVPNRTSGTFSLSGKSVNQEASASINTVIPWNNWVGTIGVNGKSGNDFSTPNGTINNTDILSTNNNAGISYISNNGYIGSSVSHYMSNYGIPPDPDGGHPNGVNIEMRKYQIDVRGERTFRNSFFKLAEGRYSFVNYNHSEIESNGSLGTRFDNLTSNFSTRFHNNEWGIFDGGSLGLWGEIQDYSVIGTRTPDANQYSASAYVIQEGDSGPLHYEFGSRLEYVHSRPDEERFSSRIGQIEKRSFLGLATSASAIYRLNNSLFIGTTAMHSFRAPTLEELFSEGPHLAAYSYEIGNPRLDPERGIGLELFLRYRADRMSAELAIYRNQFQNYLYTRDTGEQSISDPSLNNYQFVGEQALFNGVELSGETQLTNQLQVGGNISYTVADRDVSEEEQTVTGYENDTRPLPMIPPLQGSVFTRYNLNNFTASIRYTLSDEQTRLGEFEERTSGYQLLGATLQYRISSSRYLHTFSLSGNNLLNTTYQNHLSRVKEIYPEPGRGFNLLYRLYF